MVPGRYKVKLVVQDYRDRAIDAATFIPENGVTFHQFLPADFNLDGTVDEADEDIVYANWQQTGKTFCEGDATFDGVVDSADLNIVGLYWEMIGFGDFSADFNRDGVVDVSDFNVWNDHSGTPKCASRYEGDADADGDVDGTDFNIWLNQFLSQ